MNYSETLEKIHSLNRFGIKPGLERISALMENLGNPQDKLKFIHIAGTNGKGSTAAMLSNICIAAGKKTGLFISPFVVNFRERIQVNGEYIEENSLCNLVERVIPAAETVYKSIGDTVTEFEFITATAFLYFAEKNCDIVVLETGLGGRLDSTNIIKTPLLSVITKIDLDHTAVLGSTVSEIAAEKCGIIKANSAVVTPSTQNEQALKVIRRAANEKGAKFILADKNYAEDIINEPFGNYVTYKGIKLFTQKPGAHQVENMTVAAQAAIFLGINEKHITRGIENTSFPARLEVISKNPLVLLDGAHNDNGAAALSEYLIDNNIRPIVILGMMKDKDCSSVIKKICSYAKFVITVTVKSNPRAESAENLLNLAKKYCENCVTASSYDKALEIAFKKSGEENAPVLVCGSLYLASDIRPKLINMYKQH